MSYFKCYLPLLVVFLLTDLAWVVPSSDPPLTTVWFEQLLNIFLDP